MLSASVSSLETAEVRESTISAGTWSLLLHIVVLVDDAGFVLTDLCLLSLLEHRVEVFIQIILRLIEVRRRRRHLSGWNLEAILGDAEREFGLSGHVRLSQGLARHLCELVRARTGQLFRATESLLVRHQLARHGLLCAGIAELLKVVIAARARQTMITTLLNIVDEHLLHGIATDTERVLLVSLATVSSEGVAKLITCRSRQFTRLVR